MGKARVLSILVLLAVAVIAEAQHPKVPQIGLLDFGTSEADRERQQPFLEGLRDLGWIEGKTSASN